MSRGLGPLRGLGSVLNGLARLSHSRPMLVQFSGIDPGPRILIERDFNIGIDVGIDIGINIDIGIDIDIDINTDLDVNTDITINDMTIHNPPTQRRSSSASTRR